MTDDVFKNVMNLANAGQEDEAIQMVAGIENESNRLDVLAKLVHEHGRVDELPFLLSRLHIRSMTSDINFEGNYHISPYLYHKLISDRDLDINLTRNRDLDINLARDIEVAFNLNRVFANTRYLNDNLKYALVNARALENARDIGLQSEAMIMNNLNRYFNNYIDLTRGYNVTNYIDRDFAFARNLASDLASDLDRTSREFDSQQLVNIKNKSNTLTQLIKHNLQTVMKRIPNPSYSDLLGTALDTRRIALYFRIEENDVLLNTIIGSLFKILETKPVEISLQNVGDLEAQSLIHNVGPFFQSVYDLQRIYADLTKTDFVEPKIQKIERGSIIGEFIDAIKGIADLFNFEKRQQEKEYRKAKLEAIHLNNQIARMTLQEKAMKREAGKKSLSIQEKAQITVLIEEARIKRLEREQKELELKKNLDEMREEAEERYIKWAEDWVIKNAPGLPMEERLKHVFETAEAIKKYYESGVEIEFGRSDMQNRLKRLSVEVSDDPKPTTPESGSYDLDDKQSKSDDTDDI